MPLNSLFQQKAGSDEHRVTLIPKENAADQGRAKVVDNVAFGRVIQFSGSEDLFDLGTTPYAELAAHKAEATKEDKAKWQQDQHNNGKTAPTHKQTLPSPELRKLDELFHHQPGNFTLQVWVYFESALSEKQDIVTTPAGGTNWALSTDQTGVAFAIHEGDNLHTLTATKSLIPNTWNQIAVTYSFFTLTLYVNGRAEYQQACPSTHFFATGDNLTIPADFAGRLGPLSFANYAQEGETIRQAHINGIRHNSDFAIESAGDAVVYSKHTTTINTTTIKRESL
ncbi:LamG domain-containing protein [Chloroflexi bacterium TSY]|nr:LamG domain-containing protein [Chloroflexi bacterium TSY]